jgi:hypothetical protein
MIRIIGGPSSPASAASAPSGPRMRAPKIAAKLTMLPPGQERAQREGFVELFGGKPAPPLHHDPPRPGEHAAKAGQRDRGKG